MIIPSLFRRLLLTLTFLLIQSPSVFAQQSVIHGTIRDKSTRLTLPYVNIRVLTSETGTTSDKNGAFNLFLPQGRHVLRYSHIGYHEVIDTVHLTTRRYEVEIEMEEGEVTLEPMIVTPRENPAIPIIRNAIRSREQHRERIERYQLTSHSKVIVEITEFSGSVGVTINDITADSSMTMILESQTDAYWERPDRYKEVVRARKQSAFIPAAGNLLTSRFFIIDFSDDIIRFGDKRLVGPVSESGFDHYFYHLDNITASASDTVYAIRITPIDETDPLLKGTIYISSRMYQLMMVEVELNKAALPPFFDRISFRQQFDLFSSRYWMPVDVVVNGDISLSMIVTFKARFEAFSVLQNHRINEPFRENVFNNVLVKVLPEADSRDSIYWASNQAIPNTADEIEQYRRSDSIKTVLDERRNEIQPMDFLFGKEFQWSHHGLSMPGLLELYRFNRVEGHVISFPVEAREVLPGLDRLALSAGYGFNDRRFKYDARISYRLSAGRNVSSSVRFFSIADWIRLGPSELDLFPSTVLNLTGKFDSRDYFYSNGWSISLRGDPLPFLTASVAFSQSTFSNAVKTSDWSIFRRGWEYRENPSIVEGAMRSITVGLELDTRPMIDNAGRFRRIGGRSHIPTLTVEVSEPALAPTDFGFTQYHFSMEGDFDFALFGRSSYAIGASYASGRLPTQKLTVIPGSIQYLARERSFRTLGFREFSGDRSVVIFLEHDFRDQIFRWLSIPLFKESAWGLILFGGAAWSEISDRGSHPQSAHLEPVRNPFYEFGFGIDRIFLLFRVDVAWRLNHLRDGRNFAVGISAPFL